MRTSPSLILRVQKRPFFSCPWLAGLVVIVLAVFSPSLHSGFVYDSEAEIVGWDFIHDPGNILAPLTFRLMGMGVLDYNRPVSVSSLMFDSMLWGKNPLGYHLTNILLHAVVTCLVFLLIRRFLSLNNTGGDPVWRNTVAFLATLIFAVHPLISETVCEPTYRRDILSALFGVTALMLAMRHQPGSKQGDALRMFLCPLLCLLAVGSKEVGVAVPALLVLYWILFRRAEPIKFWAWTLSSSIAVVFVFLVVRFAYANNNSEIVPIPPEYPGGSLGAALLIEPSILTCYLINFFWPLYLCADYNGYSVRFLPQALSFFVVAMVIISIGIWSMRDRRVLFGAGLIALCLLPVCNLVPIYHPMADRYLYLPLIGVSLLIAIALDRAWLAARNSRRIVAAVLVVLAAALLIPVTLEREQVWSNEISLWQDTLDRNPASFPARINLPEVLLEAGRLAEAKQQSEATLKTPYATTSWAWVDYALELNRLGDRPGAERAARRALEIQPDIGDAAKMIRTLQCPRAIAIEFAQLAASLPNAKS